MQKEHLRIVEFDIGFQKKYWIQMLLDGQWFNVHCSWSKDITQRFYENCLQEGYIKILDHLDADGEDDKLVQKKLKDWGLATGITNMEIEEASMCK